VEILIPWREGRGDGHLTWEVSGGFKVML
jgi:hypothetical protein